MNKHAIVDNERKCMKKYFTDLEGMRFYYEKCESWALLHKLYDQNLISHQSVLAIQVISPMEYHLLLNFTEVTVTL